MEVNHELKLLYRKSRGNRGDGGRMDVNQELNLL